MNIYLSSSHGQTWMGNNLGTAGSTPNSTTLPLPTSGAGTAACVTYYDTNFGPAPSLLDDMCNILPPGFSTATVNPYGQTYGIRVLAATPTNTPPQSFSFMIVTAGGDTISDTDGGRISSMISGDGWISF